MLTIAALITLVATPLKYNAGLVWQAAGAVGRVREGQPVTAGGPRRKHEALLPHGHPEGIPLHHIGTGKATAHYNSLPLDQGCSRGGTTPPFSTTEFRALPPVALYDPLSKAGAPAYVRRSKPSYSIAAHFAKPGSTNAFKTADEMRQPLPRVGPRR